jgi:hypothetical protein
MLVISADRGSSAWFIGYPGTHDPDGQAPVATPESTMHMVRDVPTLPVTLHRIYIGTLHRIYMHVHETWKWQFALARVRTAVVWLDTKFRMKFRIIFQNICMTFPLHVCSREHASSIFGSIHGSPVVAGRAVRLQSSRRRQSAHFLLNLQAT